MAESTPGTHEVLRDGFLNECKHVSYSAFPTHPSPPWKGTGIYSSPLSLEPTLGPFKNPCYVAPAFFLHSEKETAGAGDAVGSRAFIRGPRRPPLTGLRGWAARRRGGRGREALHASLGASLLVRRPREKRRGRMRSEDRGRSVCCFLLPCLMVCKLSVLRALVSVSLVWDDHTYPHCLQSFLKSNEGCKIYCKLLARLSGVWGLVIVAIILLLYILPPFRIYRGN